MNDDNTQNPAVPNTDAENLKKQLSDAQNKLQEQGKALSEYEDYARKANLVAEAISRNPKIADQIRRELSGNREPATEPVTTIKKEEKDSKREPKAVPDPQVEEINKRLTKQEKLNRTKAIESFEKKYGLDSLTPKQKKEVTAKIGTYLSVYGNKIEDVPLERLEDVLDTSYKAIVSQEAVIENNQENNAKAYQVLTGSFGSINGRNINAEDKRALTAKQKAMAEKYGVSSEKAEKYKDVGTEENPFIPDAEKNSDS